MSGSKHRFNLSKRGFVIALVLLLSLHVIMGATLISMSKKALREQVEQRMLDVANTAAYQLDGDDLKNMTAYDIGSEKYKKALSILRSFQQNIQLDYIYALRAEKDGTFRFTIDPDVNNPGDFGEIIARTDALQNAAKGKADVDDIPYSDEWGTFYSAYSPIFDSNGEVAGIVGVDFNAEWFDGMLNSHKAVVVILTMMILTIGISLVFLTHTTALEGENVKFRRELKETLERELVQEQELGSARQLAYTDPLTGVKSKNAYMEIVAELNRKIAVEEAPAFGVVVCDLNGLKTINDTFGHDEGDRYIKKGCALICDTFCHSPVYRIGGDEFAVLLEGHDYTERDKLMASINAEVEKNRDTGSVVVSIGVDVFDPAADKSFHSVFERADKKMYERKKFLKKGR